MSKLPTLKRGDPIYVPTSWYLSRGADDVCGGKATVQRTESRWGSLWVYVEEVPGRGYNWDLIGPEQAKLTAEYSGKTAHPCPDLHPSANTGAL